MRFADDQIGKFYGFLTTLVVGLALNAPASATEVVADGWKVIEIPRHCAVPLRQGAKW